MSFLADIRFVRAYLLAGLALTISYHWANGTYEYWAISLYGVAGATLGAVRMPRGARAPWLWLAGGVALSLAGDVVWDAYSMLGPVPASPNPSDYLYLAGYPCVAVGLVLLSRRMAQGGFGTTVDAMIVGLAMATLLWPMLFATAVQDGSVPLGTRITAGIYPSWDIVLFVLAMRIALMRSLHTRRTMLIVGAIGLYFVGDLFWFESINHGSVATWTDYAWLAAYIAFGGAALHPSPVVPAENAATSTTRRFALLALPVALLPVGIIVETVVGRTFTRVDGLFISGLLLLMLGRLGSLVARLHRAQAELSEQNRLKDELISVVSHDLRTPLTSIMGYLELALDEDTDQDVAREFLEVVKRNCGRLHRLVEDLLFVSRVQSGREALVVAPFEIAEVVNDTVAAVRPTADQAGVVLEAILLSDDVVNGDAHRVTEVIENLLSNAIKFTPPGGRVDLWVGRVDQSLVLRVSDTGVGIAEEDCRHLFDRFYRAHGAEGVPGAGLGLSIVKAIVEAHGGSVAVESELGLGTTFEVRLPAEVHELAFAA